MERCADYDIFFVCHGLKARGCIRQFSDTPSCDFDTPSCDMERPESVTDGVVEHRYL